MALERYYNIVYDQQFSPSGRYLATCDTFGRIAVFRWKKSSVSRC